MTLKHRNLLNADSCAFFYSPEVWQPEGGAYSAKAIHTQIKMIAESGIDTYIINPTTQIPWYPSKKRPFVFHDYKRGDREYFRGHGICQGTPEDKMDSFLDSTVRFANLYLDLMEQGVDWFEETEKACRIYGMSPWASVRMNDTHGGNIPELSYMNSPEFKQDPSLRMDKPCMYPWSKVGRYAMDYKQQRVRDIMFDLIREVVEDYNYDALELDFLRDPIILNPVASREDREMMTDWIYDIRRLCDKKALNTGRPFPLGIRSSGHLNLMRDMGLDIRALANRGIIEFLSVSNFWQTSWDMPHDDLKKELGDDIAIYGVVEGGPNWLKTQAGDASTLKGFVDLYNNSGDRPMQYGKELVRGNAAGKLVLGADGIYQFNNFYSWDVRRIPDQPPAYDALRYLNCLDYLRGKEKQYTLSSQHGVYPYSNIPYEMPETLPETVEPEARRAFRIPMCREPLDENLRLEVQIICEKKEQGIKLGANFNGGWPSFTGRETDRLLFPCGIYTHVQANHTAFNFIFELDDIREGWNQICVLNGEQITNPEDRAVNMANSFRVLSVEVAIIKG